MYFTDFNIFSKLLNQKLPVRADQCFTNFSDNGNFFAALLANMQTLGKSKDVLSQMSPLGTDMPFFNAQNIEIEDFEKTFTPTTKPGGMSTRFGLFNFKNSGVKNEQEVNFIDKSGHNDSVSIPAIDWVHWLEVNSQELSEVEIRFVENPSEILAKDVLSSDKAVLTLSPLSMLQGATSSKQARMSADRNSADDSDSIATENGQSMFGGWLVLPAEFDINVDSDAVPVSSERVTGQRIAVPVLFVSNAIVLSSTEMLSNKINDAEKSAHSETFAVSKAGKDVFSTLLSDGPAVVQISKAKDGLELLENTNNSDILQDQLVSQLTKEVGKDNSLNSKEHSSGTGILVFARTGHMVKDVFQEVEQLFANWPKTWEGKIVHNSGTLAVKGQGDILNEHELGASFKVQPNLSAVLLNNSHNAQSLNSVNRLFSLDLPNDVVLSSAEENSGNIVLILSADEVGSSLQDRHLMLAIPGKKFEIAYVLTKETSIAKPGSKQYVMLSNHFSGEETLAASLKNRMIATDDVRFTSSGVLKSNTNTEAVYSPQMSAVQNPKESIESAGNLDLIFSKPIDVSSEESAVLKAPITSVAQMSLDGKETLPTVSPQNLSESEAAKTTPIPVRSIFERIVQTGRLLLQHHRTQFQVSLKPEYLGMLTVMVERVNGKLWAKIIVEKAEIHQAIKAELPLLIRQFQDQGIKLDKIDVESTMEHSFLSFRGDQSDSTFRHHLMNSETSSQVQVKTQNEGYHYQELEQGKKSVRDFGYNTLEVTA